MNPNEFLIELNRTINSMGLDIEFVEVKYHQTQNKAQHALDLSDTNKYDFGIE